MIAQDDLEAAASNLRRLCAATYPEYLADVQTLERAALDGRLGDDDDQGESFEAFARRHGADPTSRASRAGYALGSWLRRLANRG